MIFLDKHNATVLWHMYSLLLTLYMPAFFPTVKLNGLSLEGICESVIKPIWVSPDTLSF
jgi:hypothetical protein